MAFRASEKKKSVCACERISTSVCAFTPVALCIVGRNVVDGLFVMFGV